MQRRRWAVVLLLGALAACVSIAAVDVSAQPRRVAQRAPKKPARKAPASKPSKEVAAAEEDDVDQPAKAGTASRASGQGGPQVLDVKEQGDAGIKTYKFGPVEVEGRLKSPQIVYFLRRVRAEFAAGALGHRSFMGELSDTRRSPALK